jgi:hypothetical protein
LHDEPAISDKAIHRQQRFSLGIVKPVHRHDAVDPSRLVYDKIIVCCQVSK